MRSNDERTLPRGAEASDPASAGLDREGQHVAAVGTDPDVQLRARQAGPGAQEQIASKTQVSTEAAERESGELGSPSMIPAMVMLLLVFTIHQNLGGTLPRIATRTPTAPSAWAPLRAPLSSPTHYFS